jgi:hypothetical protein
MNSSATPDRAITACLGLAALFSLAGLVIKLTGRCSSCQAGGWTLALGGTCFYLVLAAASRIPRLRGFLVFPLTAALAVHATLLISMVRAGSVCVPCWGASLAALAAMAVDLRLRPKGIVVLLLIGPLAYGGATAGLSRDSWMRSHEGAEAGRLRMFVYQDPACPACMEFKARVLPALQEKFSDALHIEFRSASRMPATVDRLPTIVLAGAGRVGLVRFPLDVGSCVQDVAGILGRSER